MSDNDRWLRIAESILDGTPIPWDRTPSDRGSDDAVTEDDLRLIADVAQAYRTGDTAERVRWGSLEVLEPIGRGTFGDVYRAHDAALDRDVALKLLEHGRRAAADEARLLARVRHPNVVTVHGAAEHDGRYGLWMEFIRGRTLTAIVTEDGPLTVDDALRVGADVCRALAAVHEAGLVHGDVKAQNVMREDGGRIVLMDFGTGRLAEESQGVPLAGTPLYLAPEVLRGEPADVRSDIYSVGVLLYYLLTGAFPVEGRDLRDVRAAHQAGRRIALRERSRDVSRPFLAVIDRATSDDPASRFASAPAFGAALRDAARRWPSTRRIAFASAGFFAAAMAGLGAYFVNAHRAPTAAFHSRDFVLVGAFENRTGLPAFEGAVDAAVERELAASPFVNVAPRPRVDDALRLMMKPVDTSLTSSIAREICLRDGGIRDYITGRLDKLGAGYALTASIVDASDGHVIGSVAEDAGDQERLPAALRRLTNAVRARLGESGESIRQTTEQLEKVTTPSFEALQLYTRSYELGDRDEWPAALDLVKRAVAADPGFAVAHVWEGWCLYRTNADPAAVAAEGQKAMALASHASEWERLWIEASYDKFTNQSDAEIAALIALLKVRPDHYWAVNNLEIRLSLLGRARQAVPYAIQRARLRPADGDAAVQAAWALLRSGDTDRSLLYATRGQTLARQTGWFPNAFGAWLVPVEVRVVRGDYSGAAALLDRTHVEFAARAEEERDSLAPRLVVYNLALGRTRAALAAADLIDEPNLRHVNRAAVAFHGLDRSIFLQEMAQVRAPVSAADSRTSYLISAGRLNDAQAALDNAPAGVAKGDIEVDRARITLARGHRDVAIRMLEHAQPSHGATQLSTRLECLANLYSARRVSDRAIRILEEVLPVRDMPPTLAHWRMRNELRLAELYHEAGRDTDARPLEAEMDALLSVADADFPLLVRLKALEAKTAASRTRASVAFHARDWVLLSTFDNRTGDRRFDRTIEHALEYQLTNSTYVNVVPPSRIDQALQLMKRPPAAVVDTATAREIAMRDGNIRLIIEGWIERVGTAYAMTARVVNPADGAVIASDREEAANIGEVSKAVHGLSNWVRLTLGEAPLSVQRDNEQFEKVTTPSLEAVRLFSEGLRAFNRARFPEAEAMFTSALTADPQFASAHVWLAWTRANMKKPPSEYLPSLHRAMDLAPSASEREREWITGSFDVLTHRDDEAVGVFEAMVRRYPDDFWAQRNLIDIYNRTGRRGEVVDVSERAAAEQPLNFRAQADAAMEVVQRTGPAGARAAVARALRVIPGADENPDVWTTAAKIWILLFPAHDLWTEGRAAAAARILDAASKRPEYEIERFWTLNMLGKMRLALGQVRLAEQAYSRISNRDLHAIDLAEVALARNDRAGIAAQLNDYSANDFSAVSLLVRAGELDAAARLLPTIVSPTSISAGRAWSADEIEEARGNTDRIAAALRAGATWIDAMTGVRTFMYSETLARAAASIGERAAAIKILEHTAPVGPRAYAFFTQSGFYWMRDQKLLADLYREDGQIDKARAIERDLLARLAVADPDYPLLVELKERVGR